MKSHTASLPTGGEDGRTDILRVTSVEIAVDPHTLDRIFVVHAEDHEPMAFSIAPMDLTVILANLARTLSRSLN